MCTRPRSSAYVDLGVDIRVIAEALGHESLESTKIYTQVSYRRTRQIAELFSSSSDERSGKNPPSESAR